MSNTVDKRVVEMQFKNEDFERGVKQTIASLDSLKEALKINTNSINMSRVQREVDSLNLTNVTKGVQTLTDRFSNLGVVGFTVMQRLTNEALNLGQKLYNMSFGQIFTGGKNRAQKVADARFKLEGLMAEFEDSGERVKQVFDSASEAVNDTAFGLDEAANIASMLVGSGVEYEKMANDVSDLDVALRGIAGAAAMSNSSFEDIGRIFAQVKTAGRLMGQDMMQLQGRTINVIAELSKYLKKSQAEVREMVHKGQIDFNTFAAAMDNSFGKQAKKSNETLKGVLANVRAALARIGEIFYSGIIENKSLIKFFGDLKDRINGIKATLEPLKVPFANLVASISKLGSALLGLFDAKRAQGWKNFIDILAFVMEKLSDFIERAAKRIDTLVEKLGLKEAVEEAKEAKKVITEIDKEIKDLATSIWYGDPKQGGRNPYGNGQTRKDALGEKYEQVQTYVNAMKEANFDLEKADEIYASKTQQTSDKVVDAKEKERQAREGAIKAASQNAEQTKKMEKETNGFITMISSFVKLFQSLGKIAKSATTAFRNVFSNGVRSAGSFIVDVFSKLVDTLTITDEKAQKIQTVFEGIFGIFKMVGGILVKTVGGGFKILATILPYVAGALFKAAEALGKFLIRIRSTIENSQIFKITGYAIRNAFKDATETIKSFFTQLSNLSAVKKIKKAFTDLYQKSGDKLIEFFNKAAVKIRDFSNKFSEKKDVYLQKALDKVNEVLEKFISLATGASGKVNSFLSAFKKNKDLKQTTAMVKNVTGGCKELKKQVDSISKSKNSFTKMVGDVKGFVSGGGGGGFTTKVSGFISKITAAIAGLDVAKMVLMGFSGAMIIFALSLSNVVKKIGVTVQTVTRLIGSISLAISKVGGALDGVKKYFKRKGAAKVIEKMTILFIALVGSIAALAVINSKYNIEPAVKSILMLIGALTVMLYVVTKMAEAQGEAENFALVMSAYARVLIGVAGAVALLAYAVSTLSKIKWNKNAFISLGILATIMAAMMGAIFVMEKISPNLRHSGIWMIFYAGAVWVLAKALNTIASIDVEGLKGKLHVLVECMLLISLVSLSAWNLRFGAGASILAIVASLILIELSLKWIIKHGVNGDDIIQNLGAVITAVVIMISLATYMIALSHLMGKDQVKIAGMVIGIITALGAMVIALKIISKIPVGELIASLFAMTTLMGLLAAMLFAMSVFGQNPVIGKASKALIRISVALGVLSLVLAFLGSLKMETIEQGFGVVAALTALMVAIIFATHFAGSVSAKGFIAMIGVMSTMALIISLMSFIKDKLSLLQATGILGLALIAFAASINIASRYANESAVKNIEKMVLAVGIIAASLILLTLFNKDWTTMLTAAAGLSLVILAVGRCAEMMAKSFASGAYNPEKQKQIHNAIFSMSVLALAIGVALAAMIGLGDKNWSTVLAASGAMVIVLGAISGVLYFISKMFASSDTEKINKNIGSLNRILIAVGVIAVAISPLLYFSHSGRQIVAAALSISIVLAALTAVYWALSAIDSDGGDMTKKALALAVTSLALIPAAYALSKLAGYDWNKILPAATALGIVMIAISGALAILTAVSKSGTGFLVIMAVALALSGTVIALAFAAKLLASAIKVVVKSVKMLSEIDYSKIDIEVLTHLVGILLKLSVTGFVAALAIGAIGAALVVLGLGVVAIGAGVSFIILSSTKLVKALTKLVEVLERIALNSTAISDGITTISTSLSKAIKRAGSAFAMAFVVFAQTLKRNAVVIASAIRDFILTAIDIIFTLKVDIGRKLIEGLVDIFDMLIEELPDLFTKFNAVIILCLAELAANAAIYGMYGAIIASEFAIGLMTGLANEAEELAETAAWLTLKIIKSIRDTFNKYKNVLALSGESAFSTVASGALKVFKVLNAGNPITMGNPLISGMVDDEIKMFDESTKEAGNSLDDEINRIEKERGKKNSESYFDGQKEGVEGANTAETNKAVKEKAEEAFDLDLKDITGKAREKVTNYVDEVQDAFLGKSDEDIEEASDTVTKKVVKSFAGIPEEAQAEYIRQQEKLGWHKMFGEEAMYKMYEVPSETAKEAADTLAKIPTEAYEQMQENGYVMNDAGNQLVKGVKDGAEEAVEQYGIADLLSGGNLDWDKIQELYHGNGTGSGDNYIGGIHDSLTDMSNQNLLRADSISIANIINKAFNGPEGTDSHSPSKKAIQSMQYWIDGLLIPLESATNISSLSRAAIANANAVEQSFSSQLQNSSNGLEFAPTIRPVLDSSNMGQYSGLMNILENPATVQLAADSQLSINNTSQMRLAQQIEGLRQDINKMANQDLSKIMDGVNINVNANTTVDGHQLRKTSAQYTIGQINKQEMGYAMATGGRL